MRTPAIDPRLRRRLLDLIEQELPHATDEGGEIDKEDLIDATLARISGPEWALDMAAFRAACVRFTIYEHVRWKIRNTTRKPEPSGEEKGEDLGGTRKIISIRKGRNEFAAKDIRSLTAEEAATALADYDGQIESLARQRAELEEQRRYAAATQGSEEHGS